MALSRHHSALARPLSVPEIVEQATEFDFVPNRSLRDWLRSAQMLQTHADISEQDGNLQVAYLYLYRHAELVIGKLPSHPQYSDPQYKAPLLQARKQVQKNLAKLEAWKPRITSDYERYVKAVERRDAAKTAVQEQQRLDDISARRHSRTNSLYDGQDDHDSAIQTLSAHEHRQLAIDLAEREIRRRDATRQSSRQAGISPGTVATRRRGVLLDEPATQHRASQVAQRESYNSDQDGRPTASPHYQYPSVQSSRQSQYEWQTPSSSLQHRAAPTLPAKEHITSQTPPPVPERPHLQSSQSHAPSKYTFKPHAFTENGVPLRTIMLAPELRARFLQLAATNTSRNLETCGILCGTEVSNALFINHLIVPDQTSTSDTCDTTEAGDNALFDFCDRASLLVLGWIHTHPTQTCFLSSRDLHTSAGYQVMLPEAIAIVCAPRHEPAYGIFRLTDPPGLPHVLHCTQKGLFHPHSVQNLYTDAQRPGHVVEAQGLKFEVVDLRAKR